jgi:hypothetical protein
MGPPSVGHNLEGFAQACGFKQNVAQPRCIGPLKIEGIAEYASLVPTSRVRRVQAIVLNFANIEDRPIAMRQTRRHGGRLASQPLHRKHISSGDPEGGR